VLFELPKNIGKASKSAVPVLSAQKPWFSQGFSHFLPIALAFCSAHATRCMASCGACISRRAVQIESFFESHKSPKHWGFAWLGLVPIHAGGGGRIRTIRAICCSLGMVRITPPID
jgi:hypothetical protein